jgi:ABC-type sugar transport system substrate-binding protein
MAFGMLLLISLAVAACGGGNDSSTEVTEAKGTETVATESEETEAGEASGDPLLEESEKIAEEAEAIPTEIATADLSPFKPKPSGDLYVVTCELAIEGCSRTLEGTKSAAKVLGYSVEVCSAVGSDPESGNKCLDSALNAKPDAIIDIGLNVLAEPWYPKAKAAGIPVTGVYSGNAKTGADVQVAGGTFGKEQAEMVGHYLIAASGGKADAIVTWAQGYTIVIEKKDAIEHVLSECSGCASSALEFDAATIQQTFPQQVTAALQADPEANYVVGTFSSPATFAVPPVRELGREDVHVVGFDGQTANLELLKNDPVYVADAANSGLEPGWIAVEASARMMLGEKVPAVLPVNDILFTKDNIDELPEGFPGATDYEQQFEEMWGVR